MNKEQLQQRLSELSGITEAIYAISDDDAVDSLAHRLQESIDYLVELLRDDEECQTTVGNCGRCGGFHD